MGSHGIMTEYELRRLENMKRNAEMLAALKVHSKLNYLSAVFTKRQSAPSSSAPIKKPKTESPVILRQSRRIRGEPPDAATVGGVTVRQSRRTGEEPPDAATVGGVTVRQSRRTRGEPPDAATVGGVTVYANTEKQIKKTPNSVWREKAREQGPLAIRDAYNGDELIEIISGCSQKYLSSEGDAASCDSIDNMENTEDFATYKSRKRLCGSVDVETLQLKSDNIAQLVPHIWSLRFFPTVNMQMVVVGNIVGEVGFWNVKSEKEDSDGIYFHQPHSAPVSGFVIDPFSLSKMYSSGYDGLIRLMDVEKEVFDMLYCSKHCIYSLSQSPHDINSLYIGEGMGGISKWDVRAGKSLLSCKLHEHKINTIDFNSDNENIMATSSNDGTACIWDLRHINADKPTPLKTWCHRIAVDSAYFSPSGKLLATTSADNRVNFFSGANYENTSMVYHYNRGCRFPLRGIWGWDDSSIYIGNVKRKRRGVDVISVYVKRAIATLDCDRLLSTSRLLDAHPYNVGMLAGAGSSGKVYIWSHS